MTRLLVWLTCVGFVGAACSRPVDREVTDGLKAPTRVDDRGRVVLTLEERRALDLATQSVERGTLASTSLRFGRASARPEELALVVAPVTARLAKAPDVVLGGEVPSGAVLVSLEPLVDSASRASLTAQRRELQGQVQGVEARVRALRAEVNRVATLVSSQLATETELTKARADLQAEMARLEGLQRADQAIEDAIGGALQLRAPVAGVVASIPSQVGALLQQGEEVARIVKPGPRWIDVSVPPDEDVGTEYRVRVPSGAVEAHLLVRGAVVQPDGARRDRIEVGPAEAHHILPGMTVPVEVIRKTSGTVIPDDAVVVHRGTATAFIEVEPGRFMPREVTLGARAHGHVIVLGLDPGESVVVRGATSLLAELGAAQESGGERTGR